MNSCYCFIIFFGILQTVENTEASLEKIKRQLASNSGRNLLQGPLYKRSETVISFFNPFHMFSSFFLFSNLCDISEVRILNLS